MTVRCALSFIQYLKCPEIRGFDTPGNFHYGYDKQFIDSLSKDNQHNNRFTEALSRRQYSDEVEATIKAGQPFGSEDAKSPDMVPLKPSISKMNFTATTQAQLDAQNKGLQIWSEVPIRLHVGLQKEVYHLRDNVRTLKMSDGEVIVYL